MRILLSATPVAPLGRGKTGGVTRHILTTARALEALDHQVTILAMDGSTAPGQTLVTVPGAPQPSLASEAGEEIFPIPADGALAAMWRYAHAHQADVDTIINFAHDWLPYYLTAFFSTPVRHVVNMADVNAPTTAEIVRTANAFPAQVAFMTEAQADRFPGLEARRVIGFGLDLSAYAFQGGEQESLLWAGRISPEKGLEDAADAARQLGRRLIVAGAVDNASYWDALTRTFGDTLDYRGFLPVEQLQALMGRTAALIQSQTWHEAFGIVTVEALACGTPVVAYDRGANAELIDHGVTGFLVPHGDITGLARALGHIDEIARGACRAAAEQRFSIAAYGARLNAWLGSAPENETGTGTESETETETP